MVSIWAFIERKSISIFCLSWGHFSRLGFLNLGTDDMWGEALVCCGSLSCALCDFQRIPGLDSLDASSTPPPLRYENQRCLQVLPNVLWDAKCL